MVSLRFPFLFSQSSRSPNSSVSSRFCPFSASAVACSLAFAAGAGAVTAGLAISQNPTNPFLQNTLSLLLTKFAPNNNNPIWGSLSLSHTQPVVTESRTGVSFPSVVKDSQQLLGVGLRKKSVMGLKNINVYAFGVYADESDVKKCLSEKYIKEPRLRPTATEMLKHKFIEKCKSGASAMLPNLEKAKQVRASMVLEAQSITLGTIVPGDSSMGGQKVNEDYGDTVPSRPPDAVHIANRLPGAELSGEGDFGTVIVRGGVELDKTIPAPNIQDPSPSLGHAGSTSTSGTGPKRVEPWVSNAVGVSADVESQHVAETVQASSSSVFPSPEQRINENSSSQANVGSSGILKSETVSRKALDKLWSIYAAGNTVPIPFLRATDISPIALLSNNVIASRQRDNGGNIAVETMQELFTGEGTSKKGRSRQNEIPLPPSVYQRLTSSPTLMNLAQALA